MLLNHPLTASKAALWGSWLDFLTQINHDIDVAEIDEVSPLN